MQRCIIDGIVIDKLVEDFGSPLFVVSAYTLRNNIKLFREGFERKYPAVVVAYSYKTNYLLGILDIVHKSGAWAEVASGFEYELARAEGVSGESIIFNGPYKSREELRKAAEEGALINVDHLDEIKLLEEVASDLGRKVDIGIRLNMDVGGPSDPPADSLRPKTQTHRLPDRFGFNLESGEAARMVERCVEKNLLHVSGLHVHLTSYIIERGNYADDIPARRIRLIWPKSHNMYREAAKKILSFAAEVEDKFGTKIRYIDMGGGFPNVHSLNPYVDAIAGPILDGFEPPNSPVLILEPGRAIVRDAVHLIASVVGMKEFPDGSRGAIIDAGINLLPTSLWQAQDIECADKGEKNNLSETILYGPLCLQTDIVGKLKLPELAPGDRVIIKNVGAYNISQSSAFIFPRPAIVLIEHGNARLLRRAETVEDVFSSERL